MLPMDEDFMKRGYLLPEGCKDLHDVLEQRKQAAKRPLIMLPLLPAGILKKPTKAMKKFIKLTKWFGKPSA